MQKEGADSYDHSSSANSTGGFPSFHLFGSNRSILSGLFGGRDPFADPFFTRPFGTTFGSSVSGYNDASDHKLHNNRAKGIRIQELDSDEERNEGGEDNGDEPSVEHPEDVSDEEGNSKKGGEEQVKRHGFSVHSCKVTYGGVDGTYYTSTRTRRADSDGVVLEETKEADKTTGQATHRISRGINDKGHSFTRKLNSDGKVDALQTLHNMNEDELVGFEEKWNHNVKGYLPSLKDRSDIYGNEGSSSSGLKGATTWENRTSPSMRNEREKTADTDRERTRKVVRINIE